MIYDIKNREIVAKKGVLMKLQVAGLNLVATFLSSYNLLIELGINPSKVYVKVPEFCLHQPGYNSKLKKGDILPLYDLFYGKESYLRA